MTWLDTLNYTYTSTLYIEEDNSFTGILHIVFFFFVCSLILFLKNQVDFLRLCHVFPQRVEHR